MTSVFREFLKASFTILLSLTVFNHQWLGIPIQDVNNASSSQNGITQFGSLNFNPNGGDTFAANIITDGIGRRRLQFGGKIIF